MSIGKTGEIASKSPQFSACTVHWCSQRGEWYDGEGSTHIEDWLAEGSFDGNETIESLAKEWDS